MAKARVRVALPDDTMLLTAVQQTWWREAYRGQLPADVLEMEPAQLASAWELELAVATAYIAEERTHPVGFALIDPNIDDDGVGHIAVLGVVPRWARRGHGGRLLAQCATALQRRGATVGAWWAVETDVSIAQFTESIGWGQSGRRRVLDTGDGRLTEIEYCGTLDLQTVIMGEADEA